jgi:TetR/AcrR family transcriptional repressor of mexJK operon
LLHAVVTDISESLVATIRRTLDGTLAAVTEPAGLEGSLVDFSLRIVTDMLGSADYLSLIKLLGGEHDLTCTPFGDAPEEAVGEQLAALAAKGLLVVPDPRLAADHLIALTFGVVMNRHGIPRIVADERVRHLVVEGVRVFLRAYSVPGAA